jgi:hypothetical protein
MTLVYMTINGRGSWARHWGEPSFSMLASHESMWLIPVYEFCNV